MKRQWKEILIRQLVPNAGTLVMVALMLFGYHVWAAEQAPTSAQAPASPSFALLPYQGTLTDAQGHPLNGTVEMTFRIYDVPTGGTPLWSEAHTGSNAVPIREGLFQLTLGSLNPIPSTVWNAETLYLGIQISGDAEMTPREIIGAVPIAHIALTVPDGSLTVDQMAPMTGIVWKTPPYRYRENVAWSPSENATWDITQALEEAGVPSDAEVILLGWTPPTISDASLFTLRDANGNNVGGVTLGTNLDDFTYAPVGMPYGSPIPVPGSVRLIEYTWVGGYTQTAPNPRRMLYIYGWR